MGEHILDSHNEQPDYLHDISQNPYPDTSGLDLQAILLTLARQPDSQPRKISQMVTYYL